MTTNKLEDLDCALESLRLLLDFTWELSFDDTHRTGPIVAEAQGRIITLFDATKAKLAEIIAQVQKAVTDEYETTEPAIEAYRQVDAERARIASIGKSVRRSHRKAAHRSRKAVSK